MFADPTRGFAPVPSKLADQPFVITTKKCPLEFTQKMSTKIHLIRRMFILNLISYTSPNLEIVTDWYIQLAFLYIALWKHDFKYLPTYSIALYTKNKKEDEFLHTCISKYWMKGYEENFHSEKMTFHNLSDLQKVMKH